MRCTVFARIRVGILLLLLREGGGPGGGAEAGAGDELELGGGRSGAGGEHGEEARVGVHVGGRRGRRSPPGNLWRVGDPIPNNTLVKLNLLKLFFFLLHSPAALVLLSI